jgi:hypothetical protein
VYLRPPNIENDVINGKWHAWFNDKKTTRYLSQGIYPNTIEKQIEYVESLKNDKSKVVLCIIDKINGNHIGVISLSEINLLDRKATIALVLGEKEYPPAAPLEAMALMTEYGFDRLNLNKIYAGQCVSLWVWVKTIELIGYRIEGYTESMMIRDGIVHDGVNTGITAERFYKLKNERKGNICKGDALSLLRLRKKENTIEKIKSFFNELYK